MTLRLRFRNFETLEELCQVEIGEVEKTLSKIAAIMYEKLKQYTRLLNTQAAKFARVVDTCFQTVILFVAPTL